MLVVSKPADQSAVQPYDGSSTLAPFYENRASQLLHRLWGYRMYDLEGAVRAAIKDCKQLQKKYKDDDDRRVIATALDYAQSALQAKDKLKMVLAFEMVHQIKAAKRPSAVLKK
jgi:hypothetical protein